jgi:hypothetical protein
MKNPTVKLEPDWALTITSASNGFILEHTESLTDGYYKKEYELVQEGDSGDDVDAMVNLLYGVLNFFGSEHFGKIEIKRTDKEDSEDEL